MMEGAKAHARWEIQMSGNILGSRKRVLVLLMLLVPIILGGIVFAEQLGSSIPDILGGKKAYSPAFYSNGIFIVSILIGLGAGLITGCIGAGGGFIIAPALMSAGIKGILAVGTDLFHIFAKAIMGSIIHRKLGNVSARWRWSFSSGPSGCHRRGADQPGALRIEPGAFRRLHHHHLRAHARIFRLLCHVRFSQGQAGGIRR
jgi:hypothetical protein